MLKFDCPLKQEAFRLGEEYYKKHSDYPKQEVSAAFLQGIIFQERLSKASFYYRSWHKPYNFKQI